MNGTANYILSKMSDGDHDFDTVLKEAQEKGYAEADPTFDIEGIDSAHKIAVLTRLAYGTPVNFDDIYVQGISIFLRWTSNALTSLAIVLNYWPSPSLMARPSMFVCTRR